MSYGIVDYSNVESVCSLRVNTVNALLGSLSLQVARNKRVVLESVRRAYRAANSWPARMRSLSQSLCAASIVLTTTWWFHLFALT